MGLLALLEVISAVLWLRESEIDIECIRLTPHRDAVDSLFINPEIIIPLPEAKDYIQKKESKNKEQRRPGKSSFSLEKSSLPPDELKQRIIQSLTRPSDLSHRFRAFLEIISEEDRSYDREEIKQGLYEADIGNDIGQTGRYLSNISQFLAKKSNPHLRQAIEFATGGEHGDEHGEMKNNYHVVSDYRALVLEALQDSVAETGKELQANELVEPTS